MGSDRPSGGLEDDSDGNQQIDDGVVIVSVRV
jgi:hypothetical protein